MEVIKSVEKVKRRPAEVSVAGICECGRGRRFTEHFKSRKHKNLTADGPEDLGLNKEHRNVRKVKKHISDASNAVKTYNQIAVVHDQHPVRARVKVVEFSAQVKVQCLRVYSNSEPNTIRQMRKWDHRHKGKNLKGRTDLLPDAYEMIGRPGTKQYRSSE